MLHDQQAYRLEDALKNVSGVQTWHAYGGDYETFVMRGFLQSTANYRNGIIGPEEAEAPVCHRTVRTDPYTAPHAR